MQKAATNTHMRAGLSLRPLLLSKLANLDQAAHAAATSPMNLKPQPTERQRHAGIYSKGHVRFAGLNLSIENPAGSHRRPEWPPLKAHYGYIRGTRGADGDHVDCFIRPSTPVDWAGNAYVIDQIQQDTGAFDEHKVMLGYDDQDQAVKAYLSNYTPGWKIGKVTSMPVSSLRAWLREGPLAKGGTGSGNFFGHGGRPGQIGGSSNEGGSGAAVALPTSEGQVDKFIGKVKSSKEYKDINNKLGALQADTKSGNVTMWSIEKNTDENGKFTAARQELHQSIIDKTLSSDTRAAPGERPQAVLLLGAPGSGKTTAGAPLAKELVGDRKLAAINADDIKERLPEYKGWNAAAVHEESSHLVEQRILPQAISDRHHLMLDATGNNGAKMEAIVNALGAKDDSGAGWQQSASPTSGITAYGNTGRRKRRTRLKAIQL